MAKLTARFDMEDKISRKLNQMHDSLEKIEKSRRKIDQPMTLKVKDQATRHLAKLSKFVVKDIAKTHQMKIDVADRATKSLKAIARYTERKMPRTYSFVVSINDRATQSMQSINNYLKRRMPRSYEIVMRARDRARSVMQNIRGYMVGNILGTHMFTIMARDRAMPTMHKIANYGRRMLAKGYNFSVRAIDIATKTVGRIASFTKSAIPRYRDFTIRAINQASSVVSTVRRTLFSIPSLITVGIALVGAGSLTSATVGSAMNFEGYEVAMTHWLDGNQKQADDLIKWMGQFADTTPFSSAELFPALSRGIGVASGDIDQAQQLLEIASNMAALTPGATVSDAMEALADAQMGEFERMKSFNMKITQDDYEAAGWTGIVNEIDSTFKDGARKFSQTASGQIATLKGYASTIFREAGTGVLESMQPRLDAISKWIENNQDTWGEWKNTVRTAGEEASEWVFSKLEGGFSHIRDNYLENDEFKNLDFEGKFKFIMDDLGKWWNNTGLPWVTEVGTTLGSAIVDGIIWGVKEGIKGIGGLWSEAFKNPSLGSFGTAAIATAIGASVLSFLVNPLVGAFKIGKTILWDVPKSVYSFFGGKKGPKAPVPATTPARQRTPRTTGRVGTFFSGLFGGRGKRPTYTVPWGKNQGARYQPNVPNQFKNVGKLSTFGKNLGKFGKGIGGFAKRVPVLGTLLGVGSILAAPSDQKGEAVGNVAGGLGGAALGATIGSIVPGIGTAIGGLIGGIAGSFGGGAAGAWVDENWDIIKEKASSAAESVGNAFNTAREKISSTLFSGEWWGEKWDGVKNWTSEKWSNATELWNSVKDTLSNTLFSGDWWSEKWGTIKELTTSTIFSAGWWAEQAGFVYGYLESTIFSGDWWAEKWEAVKEVTAGTMFDPNWWSEKWESVKAWTQDKWDSAVAIWESVKTKVDETVFNSEWWLGKWESVKGWTQEKWDSAVSVWNSIKDKVNETVFNSEWWLGHWESVVGWTQEKWDSAQKVWDSITTKLDETVFSGEWWKGKWDDTVDWAQEKWDSAQEVWDSVRTALGETLFDGEWWKGKWGSVRGWAEEKLSGVGTWVSGLVEDVKERFSSGRESGQEAAKKYARGGLITRPHLGLVGEAGPEMIIPLSQNRRGRAMELYNKTGQMLGVQAYANGGLVGGKSASSSASQAGAIVQASVNINQVSAKGIEREAEKYGETFSQSVGEGINGKVVSLDNWKKQNIQTPMQQVVKEAVGFGTGTVNSFASGQNATRTNTNAHLNKEVRTPFQVIEGGASSWGSTTVNNFRSGQDSSNTGTKPYLATNVHAPFDETKAKGSVWGSGTISEFVAGMRSEGSKVAEAAKHLAEMVEKTFKEELGIKSPSRVMMRLGEFASLGIVKGLSKVDVKKFAESQAGSLAAAFAGMASIGGNVQSWLQAAMAITGVPSSWLGPLGIIAQRESGGNPGAINLWDINAQRGIPSKGLMQTIDPTFNAYKGNGMNDIWNPIHNAVAAINYIKSRYGTVFNTPGIRSMMSGGPYKGYWRGTNGPLNRAETAWVGERGPELVHLPRGAQVYSHQESMDMVNQTVPDDQLASVVSSPKTSQRTKNRIRDIIIQITGDNHFSSDIDINQFGEEIVAIIKKALEDEYAEGGEMVVYD